MHRRGALLIKPGWPWENAYWECFNDDSRGERPDREISDTLLARDPV
jgi:hypothetical protein